MRRVEILDRLELEPGGLDVASNLDEFLERPELVRIARETPTPVRAGGLVVGPAVPAAFEVIDEMSHDVGGASLARELQVFARKHVTV